MTGGRDLALRPAPATDPTGLASSLSVVTPPSSSAGGTSSGRVAYLVSQYPTLSHTFIESEVAALRALGWRVDTFSVRPSDLPDHPETAGTYVLREAGASGSLAAAARLAAASPAALGAGVRAAVAFGSGRSVRARLWQFFYLAQAIVLHEAMRRRGLRHVHVHFANNGSDIARLATTLGNAAASPGEPGEPAEPPGRGAWTWSLAVHGPTEFEHARDWDLTGKVGAASFVACISDFARSQVMRYSEPATWHRLHVVRMGVPPGEAGPRPRAASGQAPTPATAVHGPTGDDAPTLGAGPPARALRVLFVGRLVPEKGPTVLLDAVDALARESAPPAGGEPVTDVVVELVMVGTGPLADLVAARAARVHPAARVSLLGGLAHPVLAQWYAWADVFCLPSFAEGLPVVLMEAAAHGVPVVTTPIAGIGELVVDGRTGLLATPGRADELAGALARLRDDPSLRAALARQAADAVKSRHDAHSNGILLSELFTAGAHRVSG